MDLNWLMENAKNIDSFFLIFSVIIEILLMVGIFIIYKNIKNRKNK